MDGNDNFVDLANDDTTRILAAIKILVGVGTAPNVPGALTPSPGRVGDDSSGGIPVDDFLRTTNRRIFAAGDVCTEHKFPHIESVAGRIVVLECAFFRAASG